MLSNQAILETIRGIQTSDDPEEREIIFNDDPVALAWARHRGNAGDSFLDFNTATVNAEDREIAQKIRKYYSDRYAMSILRGYQLSEFRTKLYGLLQGITKLRGKDIGLLYKLPFFYEEDQLLEDLAAQNFTPIIKSPRYRPMHDTFILRPKVYYMAKRKHAEHTHWFWTNEQNQLIDWPVDSRNSLYSLVSGLFESGDPVKIKAGFVDTTRQLNRELNYYRVVNPQLVLK